ncbi:MAG: hypothetical protein GWQ05_12160 [Verrucomicrobiaceae bacterium]|nr:hypothetical protein [Verrucomicrobiaceae bacterium]
MPHSSDFRYGMAWRKVEACLSPRQSANLIGYPNPLHLNNSLLMKAQQVIFHGEVQGEGFRYAIAHEAMSYDIKGEVHNMPDGTIKAQIVGSDEEIESFLQDLRDGRFGEDITEITMEEVELEPLQRMSGFQFH